MTVKEFAIKLLDWQDRKIYINTGDKTKFLNLTDVKNNVECSNKQILELFEIENNINLDNLLNRRIKISTLDRYNNV